MGNVRQVDTAGARKGEGRSEPFRAYAYDAWKRAVNALIGIAEQQQTGVTTDRGTFLHNLRGEGSVTIPGNIDLDLPGRLGQHRLGTGSITDIGRSPINRSLIFLVPKMLGHLLIERCFQHILGELLQQPIRPRQGQPLLFSLPNKLPGSDLLS